MVDVLDDAHLRRLRERLKLRGYSPKTLKAYVLHVEHFRRYIPKTLRDVDKENITSYLIHLIDRGCSRSFINQMLSALKLFYMEVCPITFNWDFPRPKRDRKLPEVLSADEVGAILKAVDNIKHRVLLYLTYSAGLRVGETVRIRVKDIDAARQVVYVRQGKGRKDRLTLLSQRMVDILGSYVHDVHPDAWLFPGGQPGKHLTKRIAQMIF
jgi:site-specific recombinase XerD